MIAQQRGQIQTEPIATASPSLTDLKRAKSPHDESAMADRDDKCVETGRARTNKKQRAISTISRHASPRGGFLFHAPTRSPLFELARVGHGQP